MRRRSRDHARYRAFRASALSQLGRSERPEATALSFQAINLNIAVTMDADETTMERVQTELRKFCPLAKVLRQAGTTINENWIIKRP